MGKKGPLWWRESDWLLRGSSAANQILLRHSGPILSGAFTQSECEVVCKKYESEHECESDVTSYSLCYWLPETFRFRVRFSSV